MPTFSASLAISVRVYGSVEVEADSIFEAMEKLRAGARCAKSEHAGLWDAVSDVDYSTTIEETVLSIGPDGEPPVIEDIELRKDNDRFLSADALRVDVVKAIAANQTENAA